MTETCCAGENNVMILACSGGSNVGQLSNQTAVELTQEEFGKMFCLDDKKAITGAFTQGRCREISQNKL